MCRSGRWRHVSNCCVFAGFLCCCSGRVAASSGSGDCVIPPDSSISSHQPSTDSCSSLSEYRDANNTDLEKAAATQCTLANRTVVLDDNGNLSAAICQLAGSAEPESQISILLTGDHYFLESDIGEGINGLAFRICGFPSEHYPVLHFNARGVEQKQGQELCQQATPHSISLKNTGLRIQYVELRFEVPQEAPGLRHELVRPDDGLSDCIPCDDTRFCRRHSKCQCDATYALVLNHTRINVLELLDEHSSAVQIIEDIQTDFDNFYRLEVLHSAGQGAALELIECNPRFNHVNFIIEGGGTGIRLPEWMNIFQMKQVSASGSQKDGKKPVFMDAPKGGKAFIHEVCFNGTWEEGIRFPPITVNDTVKYFTNDLCGVRPAGTIYWSASEPDAPYDASRVVSSHCSHHKGITYTNATTCPFIPFKAPDVNSSVSGSGYDREGLPICPTSLSEDETSSVSGSGYDTEGLPIYPTSLLGDETSSVSGSGYDTEGLPICPTSLLGDETSSVSGSGYDTEGLPICPTSLSEDETNPDQLAVYIAVPIMVITSVIVTTAAVLGVVTSIYRYKTKIVMPD